MNRPHNPELTRDDAIQVSLLHRRAVHGRCGQQGSARSAMVISDLGRAIFGMGRVSIGDLHNLQLDVIPSKGGRVGGARDLTRRPDFNRTEVTALGAS